MPTVLKTQHVMVALSIISVLSCSSYILADGTHSLFFFLFQNYKKLPYLEEGVIALFGALNMKMTILKKTLILKESFFSSTGWVRHGTHTAHRKRIIHSTHLREQDL